MNQYASRISWAFILKEVTINAGRGSVSYRMFRFIVLLFGGTVCVLGGAQSYKYQLVVVLVSFLVSFFLVFFINTRFLRYYFESLALMKGVIELAFSC